MKLAIEKESLQAREVYVQLRCNHLSFLLRKRKKRSKTVIGLLLSRFSLPGSCHLVGDSWPTIAVRGMSVYSGSSSPLKPLSRSLSHGAAFPLGLCVCWGG